MTDRDFELLLQEDLAALPPNDELTAAVTPWRKAMNRILWGVALTTLTLNFWKLNVILPAIGMILTVLGFRSLRQENVWFRTGYVLSLLRCGWTFLITFLNTTIHAMEWNTSAAGSVITYLILALNFVRILCLSRGIRAVQKKADIPPHTGSAKALVIFYLVMTVLAIVNFEGFGVWLLLIAYICILRGLFRLSRGLDEAGYTIAPLPPKVSDWALLGIYTGILAVMLAVGYSFFAQYPMEWTPAQPQTEAVDATRQKLLDLGFPEDILYDLTEEEILLCRDAEKVHVDTEECALNDGVFKEDHWEYEIYELRITGIAVEPEDQSADWVILHHFRWQTDKGYRGTDGLQIWPTYRLEEGWAFAGTLTGRLLYEQEGETLTAPYYSLGHVSGSSQHMFFGEVSGTDLVAAFSLPRQGENRRGYVCYTTKVVEPGYIVNTWCNYYYQKQPDFPTRPAGSIITPGMSQRFDCYERADTALQMSYNVDKALSDGIYEYEPFS